VTPVVVSVLVVLSVVDSVDVCVVISVVSVVASVVVAITKYTLPSYDYQKKTMMKNIIMTYKFILVTIVTINMLIYI
jgi:Na+-transporting NADH:ubiquinone oxidoreductase subunit NqrC